MFCVHLFLFLPSLVVFDDHTSLYLTRHPPFLPPGPFCMLGLQNLRRAIQCSRTAELGLDFQIEFHPFLLDPTLTETPQCKRTRYVEKFGKDRFEVVERSLIEKGKKAGIDL